MTAQVQNTKTASRWDPLSDEHPAFKSLMSERRPFRLGEARAQELGVSPDAAEQFGYLYRMVTYLVLGWGGSQDNNILIVANEIALLDSKGVPDSVMEAVRAVKTIRALVPVEGSEPWSAFVERTSDAFQGLDNLIRVHGSLRNAVKAHAANWNSSAVSEQDNVPTIDKRFILLGKPFLNELRAMVDDSAEPARLPPVPQK